MILTPQPNFKGFDLDLWLADNSRGHEDNGLLVIFPTNRRMREFTKILAVSYPGLKIATTTIRSLALRLGRKLDPGFRLVPDEILEIFVLNVIDELKATEEVPQLTRGTVKLIKNTISEFKENGTSLETLLAELQNLNPVSTEKAAFLARVWRKLDEKLSASGMKETGDIYLSLQARKTGLPDAFTSCFPGISMIFMQNFINLTVPEVEMVEALATAVSNRIYLDFDYNTSNRNLFEKIEQIHARLTAAGFKSYTSKSEDLAPEFQKHVKEYLFKPFKPQPVKTGNIFEIEASDLYDEVTIIAKEIKQLLKQDPNLNASEICVLFHRISGFTPWIRAIFDSYGLPVNITDRFKTGDFASVSGLIDLLSVLKSNFGHTEVLRLLANPVFRANYGDPVHFKRACTHVKVGSGYAKMLRLFSEALEGLPEAGDDDDFDEDPASPGIGTSLRSAIATLRKLHDDLAPVSTGQGPGEFIRNLRDLIARTGYLRGFLNGEGGSALFNIRALSSFIRSATRLFDVMQGYDNRKRTFDEHYEIIIDLSQETRFNLVEQPETGIMITTPDEIRGLKFRHLFICALNEGDFPTRYRPEIFKYDGAAEQIKRHSAEERLLFYQALSAWKASNDSRLYLTNSRNTSSKENVESFFKREMKALFTVTRKDTSGYDDMIYTGREVWETGAWKKLLTGDQKEEVKQRIAEHRVQSNLVEEQQESPFAGYINFDPNDENGPGLPVIKRVHHPFAPTVLENYAACPYRFFAKHILQVEPAEDLTDELDARELGTLLHEILRAFHTNLKAQNKTLRDCTDEELKEYLREMIGFAQNSTRVKLGELLDTESFLSAEKILGIAGNETMSILWQYLVLARENSTGLEPALFENRFKNLKLKGLNSTRISAPYEISIHGTIDRIDIDSENGLYRVIDYKSGKAEYSLPDMTSGRKLQIPVYLLATLKGNVSQLPDEHLYLFPQIFSLRYEEGEFGPKLIGLPKGRRLPDTHEAAKGPWDDILAGTEENIRNFVLGIFEGKFPLTGDPARESKSCSYCQYDGLCRVKENMLSQASQTPSESASPADPMVSPS